MRTQNLKPVTFAKFNTKQGKGKTQMIRALLDSGGSESLVTKEVAKILRLKKSNLKPKVWSTPAGDISTNTSVKSQFSLPELHEDRIVEWNFHVAESLGIYDMIIGRDLLAFLGIDIKFSSNVVEWSNHTMPFKEHDASIQDSFHMDEPDIVLEAHERIKKILDAKYKKADLEEICRDQPKLSS